MRFTKKEFSKVEIVPKKVYARNYKRVTITIPDKFLEEMKEDAEKRGMSLSGYVRFAVSEFKKGEN